MEANAGRITLKLTSTQPDVACPGCQQLSQRVHSHYERTLRDLNWADCAVTLVVTVRKLFCDNQGCQRRIFSERLPQLDCTLGTADQSNDSTNPRYWSCFRGSGGGKVEPKTGLLL